MNNQDIISLVASEFNISPKDVLKLWNEYWKFNKNYLLSLPLKEEITEEEFSKLRTSVNISSIGHFTCSYGRMANIKKKRKNEGRESKETQTDVH